MTDLFITLLDGTPQTSEQWQAWLDRNGIAKVSCYRGPGIVLRRSTGREAAAARRKSLGLPAPKPKTYTRKVGTKPTREAFPKMRMK